MTSESNTSLRLLGAAIVLVLLSGFLAFTLFSAFGGDSAKSKSPTEAENSTNGPQNTGNPDERSETNDENTSEDESDSTDVSDGDPSRNENSDVSITAQTVNNRSVQRGEYTLYSAPLTGSNEQVAIYNFTNAPVSHTFENLTNGNRYIVEIDAAVFPAENFTFYPEETDQLTVKIGYKIRGAETYIREYNVSELTISGGEVVGSQDLIGEARYDSEGNFYTTFQLKRFLGDPSEDPYEGLYIAEEDAGYKNTFSPRSGWERIENASGGNTLADKLVQRGLSEYNRTFLREVQRDTKLYHRYRTDVGIVDIDPQTGFVMYTDLDVSDIPDIVRAQNWYSNHNETDFSAIPDDFERPDSE